MSTQTNKPNSVLCKHREHCALSLDPPQIAAGSVLPCAWQGLDRARTCKLQSAAHQSCSEQPSSGSTAGPHLQAAEQQQQDSRARPPPPSMQPSRQPGGVSMHPWLLSLPAPWEQAYYGQFEALDMINCLICPIFFANMLSRWPKDFVTAVYGVVLAVKGYQLMLLVMPAARQRHAHPKARYAIILAERILRQWVATPALGRGPRFVSWLHESAAADPGPATAVKLAMLTSGITHATWNAFCLPLDIVSQVVINVVFFFINSSSALCQMAYPMAMLVRVLPRLVWLQWGLERVAAAALWPAQQLAGALSYSSSTAGNGSGDSGSCVSGASSWPDCWAAASERVAVAPGLAPDVDTLAGRFVLAVSAATLLLTVLYMPLLFAWRLELRFKTRFLADVARRSEGRVAQDSAMLAGSSSIVGPPEKPYPTFEKALQPVPFMSTARHLGLAACVALLLGEAFVWACCVFPAVKGLLWPQIPMAPVV